MDDCYFPCLNEPICNEKTPYNVTKRFKVIFLFGLITYLVDAVFRIIIVIGLSFKLIYVQLAGLVGANSLSAIAQTALIIVLPIYKDNFVG